MWGGHYQDALPNSDLLPCIQLASRRCELLLHGHVVAFHVNTELGWPNIHCGPGRGPFLHGQVYLAVLQILAPKQVCAKSDQRMMVRSSRLLYPAYKRPRILFMATANVVRTLYNTGKGISGVGNYCNSAVSS